MKFKQRGGVIGIHVQSPFFFFASNDTSRKRCHFVVLGFGFVDVVVVTLSFAAGSVVGFQAGDMEDCFIAVNSPEWEAMFIHYCRRAISEDQRLAREINTLCIGLTAVMEERDIFFDELNVLVGRFVPEKMAKFMKERQDKDTRNLIKLQILGREIELRAAKKNIFIEKLKGNMDY
ncbi:hypothetical protein Tco_1205022 [Tanacetum coccineum]